MFNYIDYFLDRITMYRLVLYFLIVLLTAAAALSFFSLIPYSAISIIISAVFLVIVCWVSNKLISLAFEVPTNNESSLITALILALIISPAGALTDLPFLFWAGVLAMASKYILAINKKHLFNPAAIAMVITLLALGQSASWWVGTVALAPIVLVGGFLIIRKLRFEDLAWSFFTLNIITALTLSILKSGDLLNTLNQVVFHSSMLFLGSVMLTEPLTLPPVKRDQMVYGAIVGFLSVPQVHFGPLFFAPELALVIGNIFSYLASPKTKLVLFLEQQIQTSKDTFDFIFEPSEKRTSFIVKPSQKLAYLPGQYMEWTLPHKNPDSRGNRRYFTLASSPTEDTIRLGVKFYPHGSSYKKALSQIDTKTPVIAAQLSGEFTLPKNKKQKLVFLAGGIGITPFRSMLKYLVDKDEIRDIILFYTNKTADEITYSEVFSQAQKKLGIKTIYTLTDTSLVPSTWRGKVGRISAQLIKDEVPDFSQRKFYLSGPHSMVAAYEKVLKEMGVKKQQIKKDYFPGLT